MTTDVEDEYRPCDCYCFCAYHVPKGLLCLDCKAGNHMDKTAKRPRPKVKEGDKT